MIDHRNTQSTSEQMPRGCAVIIFVVAGIVMYGLFGDLFMSGPSGSAFNNAATAIIGFPVFIGAVLAFIGSVLYLARPELFK